MTGRAVVGRQGSDLSSILLEAAQPFLPHDDYSTSHAIMAQSGIYPAFTVATFLFLASQTRAIVAGPSEIILLDLQRHGPKPKGIIGRCGYDGSVNWSPGYLYGTLTVCGEDMWVHRRFFDDVAENLLSRGDAASQ